MAHRSGTERRQRTRPRSIRFTPAEDAAIARMIASTGRTFGGLVRHALLNTPVRHVSRQPSVDRQAIARLLGELQRLKGEAGKHGSLLNQLAHHAHLGRYRATRIDLAVETVVLFYERDMAELRLACLQALGREPMHSEPSSGPGAPDVSGAFGRSAGNP
jgi:hypothetical protein